MFRWIGFGNKLFFWAILHNPVLKKEGLHILSPTANVLYIAAHTILKHGPRKAILRQFYDLDRILTQHANDLDWELIVSQAKKFEWSSALYEALSHTRQYFSTPIPNHVLLDLATTKDRHQKLISAMKSTPATQTLESLQTFSALKWYGKILVLLALAFPTPAYMRWRYKFKSNWSLPAWYLIRWAGIFKDAFLTLVSLAGKKT